MEEGEGYTGEETGLVSHTYVLLGYSTHVEHMQAKQL